MVLAVAYFYETGLATQWRFMMSGVNEPIELPMSDRRPIRPLEAYWLSGSNSAYCRRSSVPAQIPREPMSLSGRFSKPLLTLPALNGHCEAWKANVR